MSWICPNCKAANADYVLEDIRKTECLCGYKRSDTDNEKQEKTAANLKDKEISSIHGETSITNTATKRNYIQKHWRGELTLGVSFWINVFFLNIFIRAFEAWLPNNDFITHPVIAARVSIIYSTFAVCIVYPWQIVGLWRACKNHIDLTGKKIWATIVQVIVVLGFIASIGNVSTSLPIYEELFQIGFGKDEYSNYNLKLTNNNKIIHLSGSLGFGVSEDVGDLLESHTDVEGIILDSIGGRIYEGRELAKLILVNGLDTYSFKGCYSACTTAFIAGKKRYLGPGGNLAFHQYEVGYKHLGEFFDFKKEQKADLRIFERQDIKKNFLDKLFNTSHADLWYPPLDELLDARVIHGLVNPSEISPIDYKKASIDFNEVLLAIPVYRTIKKYDPEVYKSILSAMEKQINKGASAIERQRTGANYIEAIAGKVLPKTSDVALIEFTRVTVANLRTLENKAPILCMQNLYPKQYGLVNVSKYLSKDESAAMLNALNTIIVDAYEKNNPKVDTKAAEIFMEKLVLNFDVEEVEYLEPKGLQNSDDYRRACDAIIKLYDLTLKEDKKIAGNVLRYIFSQSY